MNTSTIVLYVLNVQSERERERLKLKSVPTLSPSRISPDELEHSANLRARPKLIEHTEIDSSEKRRSKFLRSGWLRRQRDDRSMVRYTCNWSDLGGATTSRDGKHRLP